MQQALAKPGILKRFLTDDIKIKAITDIFTGLYSMDSNTEEGQNALRMVLTDPAKYNFNECGKYQTRSYNITSCFADSFWSHNAKVAETMFMVMIFQMRYV